MRRFFTPSLPTAPSPAILSTATRFITQTLRQAQETAPFKQWNHYSHPNDTFLQLVPYITGLEAPWEASIQRHEDKTTEWLNTLSRTEAKHPAIESEESEDADLISAGNPKFVIPHNVVLAAYQVNEALGLGIEHGGSVSTMRNAAIKNVEKMDVTLPLHTYYYWINVLMVMAVITQHVIHGMVIQEHLKQRDGETTNDYKTRVVKMMIDLGLDIGQSKQKKQFPQAVEYIPNQLQNAK
jgi:hypothetical protein